MAMWTLLSHVGVSPQVELCTWSLLGVIRSTFDATLFHINANLNQVWNMKMPQELSLPVQSALRAMITGVVLVQCFTVHLYLASYIVLLYPVFLEERPVLVLPWLLVSAVRGLLCELLSLTLGLVSCLLVGATRAPCVVFVLRKVLNIAPALYMWTMVYSYYQSLKMLTAFRTFHADSSPAGFPLDYALELAVRRRRTKSLLTESKLRLRLAKHQRILSLSPPMTEGSTKKLACTPGIEGGPGTSHNILPEEFLIPPIPLASLPPTPDSTENHSEVGFEEWMNSELPPRRNVDRILDQFVVVILKVAAYVSIERTNEDISWSQLRVDVPPNQALRRDSIAEDCMPSIEAETPPHVGSGMRATASYIRAYPRIFNKRVVEPLTSLDSWMVENALASHLLRDGSVQTEDNSSASQSEQ